MSLVQDESSIGTRKAWTAPKLDTIEMRNTAQVGKTSQNPECIVPVFGVDNPSDPLCGIS